MKSIKSIIFGTTAAAGLLFGATAFADTTYTVQPGDTLSAISTSFVGSNSLVDQIAKDNSIENINLIFPGQVLNIKDIDDNEQVTETQQVEYVEPVETYEETYTEPAQESTVSYGTSSAKEWIAQRESGGDYNATNGYHIGRYQLDPNYLNGDHSIENQERVADQYVADRYGSWENAQAFWMNNGWY